MSNCKHIIVNENVVFDYTCFANCTQNFYRGLITVGTSESGEINLPSDLDQGYLEIRISYEKVNIEFLQHLFYKRVKNGIRCYSTLYKLVGNKYVFIREIDPKNKDLMVNLDRFNNIPLYKRSYNSIQ